MKDYTIMNFLVIITCAAHIQLSDCPLPNGFKTHIKIGNHSECIHAATTIIKTMGYDIRDAKVECRKE
jgi:hypothetical protein